MILSVPRLYAISQRTLFPELSVADYLKRLFATRADLVQWREKDLSEERSRPWIRHGARLARSSGKAFLVNSHVRLAREEGADGAHLTAAQPLEEAVDLLADANRGFLLGRSVHSLAEALQAETEGFDYVMLGPVFAPLSKHSAAPPLGLEGLAEAAKRLRIPLAAVGGVEGARIDQVWAAGAWAAAGITWAAEEIQGEL